MGASVLSDRFKGGSPYWWEAAPTRMLPETPLPATIDVLVAGGGFAGMSAALTLARAGRAVLVLDAQTPGFGASTRNSGFIGSHFRGSYDTLAEKLGPARAAAMLRAGAEAHDYLMRILEREQIACGFTPCGRFTAAHTPAAYDALAVELDRSRKHAGVDGHMLSRAEVSTEIDSPIYHGGLVTPRGGSLHPGLYHQGILARVLASGAHVQGNTKVEAINKEADGALSVLTSRGTVKANKVVMATNAYTPRGFAWFSRRIFPITSNVIVTEPIEPARLRKTLPNKRVMIDTRRDPASIRLTPDGTRLQFGGARGIPFTDFAKKALEIRGMFVEILPHMADVKIEYCWSGMISYPFDKLPHVGVRDGVYYTMGHCGTGVPLSTYLGHKLALRILGDKDGATPFDDDDQHRFPARVFYGGGNPWFVPLGARAYHFKDKRDIDRSLRKVGAR
ncbi:MAG: NAD(P)/FAD-dependent oxidoreductase [Alphaproteobacteria bacterium]